MVYVADIEADGLLDTITKIHCLSYTTDGRDFKTLHDGSDIYEFVANLEKTGSRVVMHNGIAYDKRAMKKILGIGDDLKVVDTLALSWYLYPNRSTHGLDGYGDSYGVPKVKISDWENLSPEDYQKRCETDVKINWILWKSMEKKLRKLYGSNA